MPFEHKKEKEQMIVTIVLVFSYIDKLCAKLKKIIFIWNNKPNSDGLILKVYSFYVSIAVEGAQVKCEILGLGKPSSVPCILVLRHWNS